MKRLRRKHRIIEKSIDPARPPMEYMRAVCSCGERFHTYHGPFEFIDFERWEAGHRSLALVLA